MSAPPAFAANVLAEQLYVGGCRIPTPAEHRGQDMIVMPWATTLLDENRRQVGVRLWTREWLVTHELGTLALFCDNQALARQTADAFACGVAAGEVMASTDAEVARWCQAWIAGHAGVHPLDALAQRR